MIGLSIAYELSNQSDLSIAIVERDRIGKQSSWAGAGILAPSFMKSSIHPMDRLAARSFELHAEWASALRNESGIDTGFRKCGAIFVSRSAGEFASLKGQVTNWNDTGVAANWLSPNDLSKLVTGFSAEPESILAAVSVPDEAQIRNPDHLAALCHVCRERGITVIENAGSLELLGDDNCLHTIRTDANALHADRFCFATGAWSGGVMEQIGILISILPVRGQMLLFKLPQKQFSTIIYEGMQYVVPRDDGHVLVGSTVEEAGFDTSTTPDAIANLKRFANSLFQSLNSQTMIDCWAGLRPASFDGFPYIGPLPSLQNARAASGHFRNGLLLSTATAEIITDLVLGNEPLLDLSPFRLNRG